MLSLIKMNLRFNRRIQSTSEGEPLISSKNCVSVYALLVFVAFFISGCQTLNQSGLGVETPKASIDSLSLNSVNFEKAIIDVGVAVDNNNSLGISVAGFDYELLLEGEKLLDGDQPLKTQVAAKSRSKVTVPVGISYSDISRLSRKLKGKKEVPYNIKGNVKLNLPIIGIFSIPVSSSGVLPIPQMPKLSIASFDVEKVGFSGADFLLKMQVQNDNAFDLLVKGMSYNIVVDGKSWGQGKLRQPVNLPEQGTGLLEIPFSINYSDIGLSVMRLLKGKEGFDYDISGNLMLDGGNDWLKNVSLPFQNKGRQKGF
ncbi:MAG: hypothetical protein CMF25_08055 [Kangiellaceae bacterium]|nr:hypothetical protein [Kangiellaceae bacterium]